MILVNYDKSISDDIENRIKNMIVTGAIKPGDIITVNSLADNLCIGRTTIRSACLSLCESGFLFYERSGGFQVASLDDQDFSMLYEMSGVLLNASFSCFRYHDHTFILLNEAIKDDENSFFTQELKFHKSAALISRNSEIIRATNNIYEKIEWWNNTHKNNCFDQSLIDEHHTIVDYYIQKGFTDELGIMIINHTQTHIRRL